MKRTTALHFGLFFGIVFGTVASVLRIRYQVSIDADRWVHDVMASHHFAILAGVTAALFTFVGLSYVKSQTIEYDRLEATKELQNASSKDPIVPTVIDTSARKMAVDLQESLVYLRAIEKAIHKPIPVGTTSTTVEMSRVADSAAPESPPTTKRHGRRIGHEELSFDHARGAEKLRAKAVFQGEAGPRGETTRIQSPKELIDLTTPADEPTTLYPLPAPSSRPSGAPSSPRSTDEPRSPLRALSGLSLQPPSSPRRGIVVPSPGVSQMDDEDTPVSKRLGTTLPGLPTTEDKDDGR